MANIIKRGTNGSDNMASLDADNTLIGLADNDVYTIDSYKDIVVEAADGGNDTIVLAQNYNIGKSTSYTLSANVENLDISALDLSTTLSAKQLAALEGNKYTFNGNALNNTITASNSSADYIKIASGLGADTVIGGSGNDSIDGGAGIDSLQGNDGEDTLFGGADTVADILVGGVGNDTYILKDTKDTIVDTVADSNTIKLDKTFSEKVLNLTTTYSAVGIATIDASAVSNGLTLTGNASVATTIISGTGADSISGGTGLDILTSGAGNDSLYGGNDTVADLLTGGAGNDTYLIKDLSDIITESTGGGIDTVKLASGFSTATVSLANISTNVENLDASSLSSNFTLSGNGLNNLITGGSGNDTIDGIAGINTLIGGSGNDSYNIHNIKEQITELVNGGNDTIILASDYNLGKATSYTLATNIENLDLREIELGATQQAAFGGKTKFTVNGNALNNTIYASDSYGKYMQILAGAGNNLVVGAGANDYIDGGDGNDTIQGGAGSNTLIGGAGTDSIIGGSWNDSIDGGADNDTLYGGGGSNTLSGGSGNDIYLIDGTESSTTITDTAGMDTVKLLANNAGWYLGDMQASIEDYATVENLDASAITTSLTLTGNTLNNTITGGGGNDTIDGAGGIDTLVGGRGSDTYLLHNIQTTVIEITKTNVGNSNYGIDTIVLSSDCDFGTSKSYLLSTNVENLDLNQVELTQAQQLYFSDEIKLAINGNVLDNIIFASDDYGQYMEIFAGKGNDTVLGGSGNDYIDGGAGNDTLYGGAGDNTLLGGTGNDTYLINGAEDSTTISDVDGIDTIRLVEDLSEGASGGNSGGSSAVTSISLLDYNSIENIDASWASSGMTLTGNSLDNLIRGGSGNDTIDGGVGNDTLIDEGGDNVLIGGAGDDTLFGVGGNDTIDGGNGNDKLIGGVGDNILIGGAGDDILFGGGGENIMIGGAGDDTYLIDGMAAKTTITNTGGNDTIKLVADGSGNFAGLWNANISLSGYSTVQNLDASVITATDLNISGNNMDNIIICGGADDTIFGGLGSNTLIGGNGNDTYLVNGYETATNISDSGGVNTIQLIADAYSKFAGQSNATFSIANYNEISTLDASHIANTDLTLVGNSMRNTTIIGGGGNDTIIGGADNILLEGGAGNDSYLLYGTDLAISINDSSGDDTYLINGSELDIGISDSAGNDTVKLVAAMGGSFVGGSAYTITSFTGLENLDASAISTGMTLTGNATTATTITSGAGNDAIIGGTGNDTLYGGGGSNALQGGAGNDTYLVDDHAIATTITDTSGNDTIKILADANGAIQMNTSNLLTNNTEIENLDASSITKTNLTLNGNSLDNTIIGGDGNDTINGGSGADNLLGGAGDDTYVINGNGIFTVINDTSGFDTVKLIDYLDTSFSLVNCAGVEVLDASGGTAILAIGNDLDNTIYGGGKIIGGKGNDTLYGASSSENVSTIFSFSEGDQRDVIAGLAHTAIPDSGYTAENAILIDDWTGNLMFYTDKQNNFYIDYGTNAPNSDVVEMTAGSYNADVSVALKLSSSNQIGTINMGQILQYLSTAPQYTGLDAYSLTMQMEDESQMPINNLITWQSI